MAAWNAGSTGSTARDQAVRAPRPPADVGLAWDRNARAPGPAQGPPDPGVPGAGPAGAERRAGGATGIGGVLRRRAAGSPARAGRRRGRPSTGVARSSDRPPGTLGVGIGWRPEIDLTVERLAGVDFVEVVAESLCPDHLPESVRLLRARGLPVLPHGVTLSLGGAEPPDADRLAHLARCAEVLGSPLVSEHVAFVRAGGVEAGHLLPVPRTRDALDVLVANVRIAQAALPVPLVLENVAALLGWPDDEMTDGRFLAELVERTGVGLLLDVANLWTNQVNLGLDASEALSDLPLEAVAYVHVAGGVLRDGVWHDTHTHPVPPEVLDLLASVRSRVAPPGVLLERDGAYPSDAELAGELAAIRRIVGGAGPAAVPGPPPALPSGPSVDPAGPLPPDASGLPPVCSPGPPPARLPGPPPVPALGPPPVVVPRPSPDPARARERLGRAQAGLVDALVRGGGPAGFDPERVLVQADALRAKRRDLVARAHPDLAERPDFRAAFDAYARTRPRPPDGVRADAAAFAAHLAAHPAPGGAPGR